jgi:hypothetical protein
VSLHTQIPYNVCRHVAKKILRSDLEHPSLAMVPCVDVFEDYQFFSMVEISLLGSFTLTSTLSSLPSLQPLENFEEEENDVEEEEKEVLEEEDIVKEDDFDEKEKYFQGRMRMWRRRRMLWRKILRRRSRELTSCIVEQGILLL